MTAKEIDFIRDNISNYDLNGQLDVKIKKFNINEERVQCPLCEHCEPILTLAHITTQHEKTLLEAKDIRSMAEVVTPFKKNGEKYNEQLKQAVSRHR